MKKLLLLAIFMTYQFTYSQWESLNDGLYGGTVNSLLSIDGATLAGTNGGIFRSIDHGETWSLTNVSGVEINSFCKDGTHIYAGGYKALYISEDNGVSWVAIDGISTNINSMVAAEGVVYIDSHENMPYRSTDNGKTWTEITVDDTGLGVQKFFVFEGYVFASTYVGVYRSSDKGESWSRMNYQEINSSFLNFAATSNNIFTAVGPKLMVSTDYGETWKENFSEKKHANIQALATRGREIYVYTAESMFYSLDEGMNWSEKKQTLPGSVNEMVFDNEKLFVGTLSNGIFFSTDSGASWSERNTGLTSMGIYNITTNGDAKAFISNDGDISNDGNRIYYSTGDNVNWMRSAIDATEFRTLYLFHNKLYLATWSSGIFVSSDNGATWYENNSGHDGSLIFEFRSNNDTLYAVGTMLYKSIDGIHWTKLDFSEGAVSILPINDKIYISTRKNREVYVSSDGGQNWLKKMDGIPKDCAVIALYSLGSQIIAGTDDGFYILHIGSHNWEKRSEGFTNKRVYMFETIGNNVIAASQAGLFMTKDEGITWQDISGNLPDSIIVSIKIHRQYIYIGTKSNGIYRAKLADFGITSANDPVGENKLRLFPNPASEYLTVEFPEAAAAAERITILDLLGAVVLETSLDGSAARRLDISRLPAGAYFARIGGISKLFLKL